MKTKYIMIMKKTFIIAFALLPLISIAQINEKATLKKVIKAQIDASIQKKGINAYSPNWNKIKKENSLYNDTLVDKAILSAKRDLAIARIDSSWNDFANAWLEEMERFGNVRTTSNYITLNMSINNTLYYVIFKNVKDKKTLLRAAKVSMMMIENPHSYDEKDDARKKESSKGGFLDTYANLLYKAGEVQEAIKWQAKALELSLIKDGEIAKNLQKMQKGRETW